MINVKDLIDLDQDIDHVTLRRAEGYFSASCDYGVLADNDFLEVLIECVVPNIRALNIIFLDFIGVNKTTITETVKVNLEGDPSKASEQLDKIRRRYIAMDGKFSSRYVIMDELGDFIIVSEESVPLSRCFFKNKFRSLLDARLLSQYTY
jgi:hypothetical protein